MHENEITEVVPCTEIHSTLDKAEQAIIQEQFNQLVQLKDQ